MLALSSTSLCPTLRHHQLCPRARGAAAGTVVDSRTNGQAHIQLEL